MGDQFSLLYKQQLKMRSLSAILFVGCVAAAAIQPYSWTPSKEYRYKYSAQALSGIPELNNQFSGVRFNSEVLIQPQEDSTCLIKIENVELTSYNEEGIEMTHDWTPKEKHGEREEIPSSIKSQIETPFVVFHKKGKVEMIETELGESESIINIKKVLYPSSKMIFLNPWKGTLSKEIRYREELMKAICLPLRQRSPQSLENVKLSILFLDFQSI